MNKFEEDLNNKINLKEVPMYFTQSGCSLTRKTYIETNWIFDNYGNWHPDEQFQKAIELAADYQQESENINQINSQLTKEIADLKSQLQQQALPVVPECVGEFIEDCKKEGDCLFGIFADATRVEHDMPDLVYFWLGDEGNNDELFARAWLDGYTVEKSDKCMVKLGALYFKCWNDVDAVFIIDDQPGAYESAFVFKKREDAEKVAQLVGGRVVKN